MCNYLELEKPIYFKFLDTLTYKAIRDRLFIDRDKNVYEKVQKEYEEMISNHKKLQYDLLYGEKYIREYIINYNKEKS